MRTTLPVMYMLLLSLLLLLCGAGTSPAEAAERRIRPRRVNRSAPKVLPPVVEDGTSQSPLPGLTPPDSAIWPPEQKETADGEPRTEAIPEEKPSAEQAADAAPIAVPQEEEKEVNRRREDFHAPLTEEIRNRPVPAPRPAPAPVARETVDAPGYREPETEIAAPESIPPEAAENAVASDPPPSEPGNAPGIVDTIMPPASPLVYADGTVEERAEAVAAQPTPQEVENYRRRLEFRLLERYNNLPQHAGNVGKVSVVLSRPLQPSLDGTRLRAEFDQLVYDPWGRRIPALEKEYYVVTFGSGGARQVRSDPSVRVGLNYERTYSEPGPESDIAEKIRRLPSDHAFRAAPKPEEPPLKMPDWWRPDFAEDGY